AASGSRRRGPGRLDVRLRHAVRRHAARRLIRTRLRQNRSASLGCCVVAEPRQPPDDLALVERLRAGDETAFMMLVDELGPSMRRVARMYVSSDAVTDEVVQEAWLGVVKGLDGFEGRASLRTWVFRILVNTAKTRGQRESRSVPFAALAGDDLDQPTFDPTTLERVEAHLAGCDGCTMVLEEFRETIRLSGGLTVEQVDETQRRTLLEAFRDWRAGS